MGIDYTKRPSRHDDEEQHPMSSYTDPWTRPGAYPEPAAESDRDYNYPPATNRQALYAFVGAFVLLIVCVVLALIVA